MSFLKNLKFGKKKEEEVEEEENYEEDEEIEGEEEGEDSFQAIEAVFYYSFV